MKVENYSQHNNNYCTAGCVILDLTFLSSSENSSVLRFDMRERNKVREKRKNIKLTILAVCDIQHKFLVVIKKELRGFSPQANYRSSDRRRPAKLVPTFTS
jgi:hypothetical protein